MYESNPSNCPLTRPTRSGVGKMHAISIWLSLSLLRYCGLLLTLAWSALSFSMATNFGYQFYDSRNCPKRNRLVLSSHQVDWWWKKGCAGGRVLFDVCKRLARSPIPVWNWIQTPCDCVACARLALFVQFTFSRYCCCCCNKLSSIQLASHTRHTLRPLGPSETSVPISCVQLMIEPANRLVAAAIYRLIVFVHTHCVSVLRTRPALDGAARARTLPFAHTVARSGWRSERVCLDLTIAASWRPILRCFVFLGTGRV